MKNQTPRWRKAVYRFVLFPAAVILIAALGYNLFIAGNSSAGSAGALPANIILATTAKEAKAAQPTFEAQVESHKATCFVICDGAIGKAQIAELNAAAAQHADVLFVVMSSESGGAIIKLVAQSTGGTVAFPLFVCERKDGERFVQLGVLSRTEIDAWVTRAMTATANPEDGVDGALTVPVPNVAAPAPAGEEHATK